MDQTKEYFEVKQSVLSKVGKEDISLRALTSITDKSLVFDDDEFKNKYITTLAMAKAHREAQPCDLSYDKYSVDIRYDKIDIVGDNATASIFVTEKIYFNIDDSILSEVGSMHTLELRKSGNNWVVSNDDCPDDEYAKVYETYKAEAIKEGSKSAEQITDFVLASFSQDIQEDVTSLAKEYETDPNAANVEQSGAKATAHYYNSAAPVSYALTYARSNNPSPWATYPADCTNYTSIAVNKNVPKDTVGSGDDRKWYWNSRSSRVPSWTSPQFFRRYIYCNNNSTSSNVGIYGKHDTYNACSKGDIIQYCSDGSGTWSVDGRRISTHGSIITKTVTDGPHKTHYVCMHSYGTGYSYNYPASAMPYTYKHFLNIVKYFS